MRKSFVTYLLGLLPLSISAQSVLINEIMYHPSSENILEEWVELFNPGPTNVNLAGWQLASGVRFSFPSNATIFAGGYLVVAANTNAFAAKYPGVANVVGNWVGILSNSRNRIDLNNPAGETLDSVTYADDGDWGERRRGPWAASHPGWIWYAEHDGLGKSIELINPNLPNEVGQNWLSSAVGQGTPGAPNSVRSANVAPLIAQVSHIPNVPRSTDSIRVVCRVFDEQAPNVTVRLYWRVDSATPPPFTAVDMLDNGMQGDGAAGDGLYGVVLGTLANGTLVEFYVEARDGQSQVRTWPAPARRIDGTLGQLANTTFQVDDQVYTGPAPLYRLIMTTEEYQDLSEIFTSDAQSDAQVNATFVSHEMTGESRHYLAGVRNRGHGSRTASVHNYRVNFPADDPWKGVTAINLNSQNVAGQHLGGVVLQRAGAVGGNTRAARLRVNNGPGPGGTPSVGHYAAVEVPNSEWAENHFPLDPGGNVYKVVRDIKPPDFNYRGEDPNSYRNTYFKENNVSEDDWSDLIGMLRVVGINNTVPFDTESVRQVVNVEQWMTHLAVMAICNNTESGLNTGNNDDYYMYAGAIDRRFNLVYHDLDSLMAGGTSAGIWGATTYPVPNDTGGSGQAFSRLMRWPDFEPIYYATLQRLLDTTFSAAQFEPLVDQVLGDYVAAGTRNNYKTWMANRRTYVLGLISGLVPPTLPFATLSGVPRSPSWMTTASLVVGGPDVVAYRYRLNNGGYGAETPVAQVISLNNLPHRSTNVVYVVGKNASGIWQDFATPTVSPAWIVLTNLPKVRINEVLARNVAGYPHFGTFPDVIELFNESIPPVDLSGMRLTDNPAAPDKFTFAEGTVLGPRAHLVLLANDADGTSGTHLGFSLDQAGEGVYLFDAISRGGALVDSVTFGNQLADLSIGRNGPSGDWILGSPSVGTNTVAVALGADASLRINEWLTAGLSPFPDDFIELYNTDPLPVNLGGLYLTDNPIGAPAQQRVPDLTFIPGQGYLSFIADGQEGKPGHVNFSLGSELGTIGLLDARLRTIDCVSYGPQQIGVSVGRCPTGTGSISAQVLPTPEAPNACPVPPVPAQLVPLITGTYAWRYNASGTNPPANWAQVGFDDSAWFTGQAILAIETCNCTPDAINTPLSWLSPTAQTAFYFRTTFVVTNTATYNAIQLEHAIDDGAIFYLNGQEVLRLNMPGGAVNASTRASVSVQDANAYSNPVLLPLNLFNAGTNTFAVEVHNQTTAGDMVFGMRLSGQVVTNSAAGVVINEVLASNNAIPDVDGRTPDLVELYNKGTAPVNLAGVRLADALINPSRTWAFPVGVTLAGKGYLVVQLDPDRPASTTNTGFGLRANGDGLYLLESIAGGGALLDFISFGVQATDFSLGRVPDGATNWVLNQPTFSTANIPAALGDPNAVRINEWMADPGGAGSGPDWFELVNPTDLPIAIGGLFLTDDLATFDVSQIPARSFLGTSTNSWQKFIADRDLAAGADHVDFNLRGAGEDLGLFRANGVQVDAITFDAQTPGVSEGRLPDGAGQRVFFPTTASPSEANHLPLTNVVINEVLTHTDPPLEDAIEVRNLSNQTLDVSGWWFSDAKSALRKYQIPPNTTLGPQGLRVFYEFRFNDSDFAAVPFSLSSAKGDEVYLSAAPGGVMNGYRTRVDFGASANGVSFGRFGTSLGHDFVPLSTRTFGQDNPASLDQFRLGTGLPNTYALVSPVVISEIMFNPPLLGTNDNTRDEFVELHNRTASPVPLYDQLHPTNTWRLRKGADFDFPAGVSIQPGGYLLVVSFDPATNAAARAAFEAVYGANHTLYGPYDGKLDNGGEPLELQRPDAPQTTPGPDLGLVPYITVERIVYDDLAPWPTGADGTGFSLQRRDPALYGNEPTNWVAAAPSPGPGSGGVTDTDADGMPDAWEDLYGLNRNVPDGHLDPDLDGLTNLEEFQAGTDPNNPGSVLRIAWDGIQFGQALLHFNAVAGKTYTILYGSSPRPPSWESLTNVPAQAINRQITIADPDAGSQPRRFYYLRTPAIP